MSEYEVVKAELVLGEAIKDAERAWISHFGVLKIVEETYENGVEVGEYVRGGLVTMGQLSEYVEDARFCSIYGLDALLCLDLRCGLGKVFHVIVDTVYGRAGYVVLGVNGLDYFGFFVLF